MNNILAGHTNSYHTYSLDEALSGIARAGFRYVELSAVRGWTEQIPLDANAGKLSEVRAKLQNYGLQASALSGHSDLTTAEGVVIGKQAIDLCQKLGITLMNTAIGGHYSEDEDKDAFMGYIHELADYAADRGITIGLEVHGDIMASGALSIPLIKEIDRPNVGINYDTANCVFYGGVQAVDDLRPVVPYLVHVHLKDKIGGAKVWNFPAVGEGELDFAAILQILAEEGYHGPTSIEIEFSGEPWPPLEEVDRSMKVSYATLQKLGMS
ncbi:MAG: sugar phosphate isomerase/epimerase [Caldilineaceae bacterium]|nr:sugar phosphate isomerase/epimerase [Caldilineaceae bacterium]